MRMTNRVSSGDVIAVPIEGRGWCIGVVARTGSGRKARALLVYFYPNLYTSLPEEDKFAHLDPSDSPMIMMVSELGLIEGNWCKVGRLGNWKEARWPIPPFGRKNVVSGRYVRVTYHTPDQLDREEPCSIEEGESLPPDGLAGYQFAEDRLNELVR